MISKELFIDTYNKNEPNKFIKFMFKYFSSETEKKNMRLSNTVLYSLMSLFNLGYFSTLLKFPRYVISGFTYMYMLLLIVLVFSIIIAAIMNNFRIKRICKALNIKHTEYNKLAKEYLHG